jgi:hypothetical protein
LTNPLSICNHELTKYHKELSIIAIQNQYVLQINGTSQVQKTGETRGKIIGG